MDEESFDQQISHLVECFPDVDLEIITEAVLESGGSYPDAVDHVLARITAEKDADEGRDGEGTELSSEALQLKRIFPTVEIEVINAFLAASSQETNIDVLCDELILHLEGGAISKNRKIQWKKVESGKYCAWKLPARPQPALVTCRDSKNLKANILDFLRSLIGDQIDVSLDPQELREGASELHLERSRVLAKASNSHSHGGLTGNSSAQYYAAEACKITRKIEALHRKAGYLTFLKYNENNADDEIDFHELLVSEAIVVLDLVVQSFNSPDWKSRQLKIITGVGRHSVGGPRLRPAIWQRLCELDVPFRYESNAAFLLYK